MPPVEDRTLLDQSSRNVPANESTFKEFSLDPFDSTRIHPQQYHYFGLAPTQSQNNNTATERDGEDPEGSSQKENFDSSESGENGRQGQAARSASPQARNGNGNERLKNKARGLVKNGDQPSSTLLSSTKGFQDARAPHTKPAQGWGAAVASSSIDSFSSEENRLLQPTPEASMHNMDVDNPDERPRGTVLVAATPSNSDGSQLSSPRHSSRPMDEDEMDEDEIARQTQLRSSQDDYYFPNAQRRQDNDRNSQHSSYMSDSSEYNRFGEEEDQRRREEALAPSQPATQPATQLATQFGTQAEDDAAQAGPSHRLPGGDLLRDLPPEKRARYLQRQNDNSQNYLPMQVNQFLDVEDSGIGRKNSLDDIDLDDLDSSQEESPPFKGIVLPPSPPPEGIIVNHHLVVDDAALHNFELEATQPGGDPMFVDDPPQAGGIVVDHNLAPLDGQLGDLNLEETQAGAVAEPREAPLRPDAPRHDGIIVNHHLPTVDHHLQAPTKDAPAEAGPMDTQAGAMPMPQSDAPDSEPPASPLRVTPPPTPPSPAKQIVPTASQLFSSQVQPDPPHPTALPPSSEVPDSEPSRSNSSDGRPRRSPVKPLEPPRRQYSVRKPSATEMNGQAQVSALRSSAQVPESEDEEDDDYDDVPLVRKGKGKVVESQESRDDLDLLQPSRPPPASAKRTSAKRRRSETPPCRESSVDSPENRAPTEASEVPTEIADVYTPASARARRAAGSSKVKPKPSRSRSVKSKKSANSIRTSKKRRVADEEEEEEEEEEGSEMSADELPQKEDVEMVEVAGDRRESEHGDGMDMDELPEYSGRKGKGVPSRSASRAKQTPLNARTRTLRSAGSAHVDAAGATRCFARWKDDGHYYPGTILGKTKRGKYKVFFDDQTHTELNLEHLRRYELRKNEEVYNIRVDRIARFKALVSVHGKDRITATLDGDKDVDWPTKNICVLSYFVKDHWGDRMLDEDTITISDETPARQHCVSPAASTSNASTRWTGRVDHKPFLNCGIIVTKSKEGDPVDKQTIREKVEKYGGTIIEDWQEVIRLEGTLTTNNWVLSKKDAEWLDPNISQVYVVSESYSQTPKFLMAVALGVPCLRLDWWKDSLRNRETMDIVNYLLPQGHSEYLNTDVSQFVNLNWCNFPLAKIMQNPVASKLFQDKTILCLGGKEIAPDKEKGALPRIILAMGANTVEVVRNLKHAERPLGLYDYVVLEDVKTNYTKGNRNALAGCTVVDWLWVKDSLITGRVLPLPDWGS